MKRYVLVTAAFITSAVPAAANVCEAEMGRASARYGVPLGVLLGSNERVYRSVEFLVDFFRSTPSSALIPLFLLIFGVSAASAAAGGPTPFLTPFLVLVALSLASMALAPFAAAAALRVMSCSGLTAGEIAIAKG